MGLLRVIISSSAGCISVALSLLAIRRTVRRQKRHHRKRTTDLRPTAATDVTTKDTNGAQINAFTKPSAPELVRKRRAIIVQMHHGKPAVSNGSHSINKSIEEGYALDRGEASASNVVQEQDQKSSVILQDTRTTSSPFKEFTVLGSNGMDQDYYSTRSDFFMGNLVDDGNTSTDSCSETESCSFAGDEFLSQEEIAGAAETVDETFECSHPCSNGAKRVSFQLADGVCEQQAMSNSRADYENPVSENVLAIENLLHVEDVEIHPGNDGIHNGTSGNPSGASTRVLEVMDRGVLMGRSDAVAITQDYSEGNDSEQGIVLHMGKRDNTPVKARKPFLVSVEPLAQMPVLEEALNLSPATLSPEINGYPISWAADTSEPNRITKDCDEREAGSAAQLQKEYSETSYRCSEDEKENISGVLTPSLGKLRRKTRREDERPGMFRRSSYPSLRRFRFSDRIKVRPLRSSGRNSK